MIDRNGKLQIIDFDRYDFGDPWEEFNRIVWCAQKSPLFASGMVNGYFDGDVPPEFWRSVHFKQYALLCVLGYFLWTG